MDIQVFNIADLRIAMIRHQGPYEQIGGAFERLWTWVNQNRVPVKRSIGIYYDNPDYVAANQLRSAACVEVPPDFTIPPGSPGEIELGLIVGGPYAATKYVGPYAGLGPVWSAFTSQIEGPMNRRIAQTPAFEVYVNDPSTTPESQLITELYMPLL